VLTAVPAATPPTAYRGPARGPSARPPAPIEFVAADLTDGDIATVARGVQQAATAIGWPLRILDGQGTTEGQAQALQSALSAKPGGIVLGGFDAAGQAAALRAARTQGVPVVGWHAAARPGPDQKDGLFTNVAADPAQLARVTAGSVVADSQGSVGVVIFTDAENAFDAEVSSMLVSDIGTCRHCSVLSVVDSPIATASVLTVGAMDLLLHRFGARLRYVLAMDGGYIDGAAIALAGVGRSGEEPPFLVSVSGGDESEFARIRTGAYQKAAVVEPLNLQGWQLIDELNRARAGKPASDYVAPPFLVTQSDVGASTSFEPAGGYQKNFLHIWGRSGPVRP